MTLPLMAIGGRGVISVASNEIPGEMVQMVEAAERGDFAAARAIHARIMPLMQVNFVESNPVPVKAAMAAMGLLEEVYRLPMCAAQAGIEGEDPQRAEGARAVRDPAPGRIDASKHDIAALGRGRARRPIATPREPTFARLREALSAGHGPRRRARCRQPGGLARERVGEAGHPARVQVRRHRRRVDGSRPLAVLRQGHAAAEEVRRRRRRAHRARRIVGARRRLHRARRHLHAADVRQHRRLYWRAVAHRFACARRVVRAGRRARARQRRRADRRRHRAGRRAAGDRRRRSARSAATPESTRARSSRRAR